jgi:hypothetical protein
MIKTKIDAELAESEEAHANDPERAEIIARTRRFKASWLELAEALTHVRRHDTWKRWGFESFEQYGVRELRLRQETIDKLTGSYAFLQKKAPGVLRRDPITESIPSYQAVDYLRRAEEYEDAPEDAVAAMRTRILDEGVALPAVVRELGERVFPIDDAERTKRELSALRGAAMKLRDALARTRAVPRAMADGVAAKIGELLDVLGEQKKQDAA